MCKPDTHGFNTSLTHNIRCNTHHTHHHQMFDERKAGKGYYTGGQEKEWLACLKRYLKQDDANRTIYMYLQPTTHHTSLTPPPIQSDAWQTPTLVRDCTPRADRGRQQEIVVHCWTPSTNEHNLTTGSNILFPELLAIAMPPSRHPQSHVPCRSTLGGAGEKLKHPTQHDGMQNISATSFLTREFITLGFLTMPK